MGNADKLSNLAPSRQLTPRPSMSQRPQVHLRLPNDGMLNHLPDDGMLNLVEMFPTLQGEGPAIGQPVYFIRMAICNLKCVWCDTDYRSKAKIPTEDLAIHLIELYRDNPGKAHIILTGGEPTLQAKQLCHLVDICRQGHEFIDWEFDCESNANWLDNESKSLYRRMKRVILSPKPPSSQNGPYDWVALWEWLTKESVMQDRVYIKPVIMDDLDWQWLKVAAEMSERPLHVPIIMQTWVDPAGDGLADFRGYWRAFLTPERIEWMRQYNVRLMPRLHNLIWGNEQGY